MILVLQHTTTFVTRCYEYHKGKKDEEDSSMMYYPWLIEAMKNEHEDDSFTIHRVYVFTKMNCQLRILNSFNMLWFLSSGAEE